MLVLLAELGAQCPGTLMQLEEQRCKKKEEENCQTATKLRIEITRADAVGYRAVLCMMYQPSKPFCPVPWALLCSGALDLALRASQTKET